MTNSEKKIVLSLGKSISKSELNKLSCETIENYRNDINRFFYILKRFQKKIEKCDSIEKLIEMNDIQKFSTDLGLINQNSIIVEDISIKKNVEDLNQLYRETEVIYFNKKIELLDAKVNGYDEKIAESFKKSQDDLKEITGGTLFSISSVFLGISLTSAIVAGVQHIGSEFIILYFMTCLLISVISIGLAAIFMGKADEKSRIILIIISIVSILWFVTAFFSYNQYDKIKKQGVQNSIISHDTNDEIKKNDSCN